MNKREDVRNEIVMKTREIISRFGFKKSSTEEIAKTLNKTKAALYHYFENREEIIKAVVNYEGRQLIDALKKAVDSEADPHKKLEAFGIARAKKINELGKFYRLVIEEFFARYPFVMNALGDYIPEELNIIETIIHDGIRDGIFVCPNVSLTSKALIKSMRGYDFFMFQGEQFKGMQAELTETLKIFTRGISKK